MAGRRKTSRANQLHAEFGLQRLEQRSMLSHSPLPTMGMLESASNTVVRLETNFGDIDFELFDSVAPGHVTAFLSYVIDGDYDDTFFHRLDDDFVLQGGGFRFRDGDANSPEAIPSNGNVVNNHSRSNLIRTIALARIGGQPNSGTNQFFINLANNTNLNTVDGGFTVFGRVLGDASWNVVQTINNLTTRNFGTPFNELPLTDTANTVDGVQENELVYISDVEIIKRGAANAFYSEKIRYPEGFAGSTINEFLPISNPNNAAAFFQVIVRSEGPLSHTVGQDHWYRDQVIFEGSVPAHSRGGITISQFAHVMDNLVQQGVPYAIEIHSTLPVSANLSHYDFGTATGESFTKTTATTWAIPDARKDNGNISDFLVWQNAGDTDATITITFVFGSSATTSLMVTTEHHRRGGLDLSNTMQVPDDTNYSIVVTSTQPIILALTHYDIRTPGTGSTTIGTPGGGSVVGVLPIASTSSTVGHILTFVNTTNAVAVVTLDAHLNDGTVFEGISPLIISPSRRASIDLSTVTTLRNLGQRFSIVFASNAAVYGGSSHVEFQDGSATPITDLGSTNLMFAEGFMDPARAGVDVFEHLAVFNPNFNTFGIPAATANLVITVMYNDGFQFTINQSVLGGRRFDLNLHANSEILNQGTNFNRFFYAIRITSNIPIVGQFNHYDLTLGVGQPSGGFSTLGTELGTAIRLDTLDD